MGLDTQDVDTGVPNPPADVDACNRTVPKPCLFTLKGICFERKQNPRNCVMRWKGGYWIECFTATLLRSKGSGVRITPGVPPN